MTEEHDGLVDLSAIFDIHVQVPVYLTHQVSKANRETISQFNVVETGTINIFFVSTEPAQDPSFNNSQNR